MYALTGDKINLRFTINDQEMGSEIKNCKKNVSAVEIPRTCPKILLNASSSFKTFFA